MAAQHWSTYARGERKQRGEMNRTEQQFAAILEAQRLAGQVIAWWYEAITFKLTDSPADKRLDGLPVDRLAAKTRQGTRYTPDFSVLLADERMIHYEVKGTGIALPADLNRVKAAAERYPFRFYVATKLTKKAGGGFEIEEF